MERSEYIELMLRMGFPEGEAEKMADFAQEDFDSYQEAADFYLSSGRFWRGTVYAGARKARRLFRKRRDGTVRAI